ncbi:MAG: hypothetical protein C0392_03800 [Syntrophus sp. (in: bacteria)]|nr:hypothetical protein [Syntrophus sp. (in: bacteria)]
MIEFSATYFDGKSSRPHPVTVSFDGMTLRIAGEDLLTWLSVPLRDCTIDPPLGQALRVIRLPDGGLFETGNMPAFKEMERQRGVNKGLRCVHFLESNWKTVVGCMICLVVFAGVFLMYGIPFLAARAANSIPTDLMETMSRETLKVLDSRFLKPSQLPREKADRVRLLFQRVAKEVDRNGHYRLEFRKGGLLGPNAFALPSGIILVTDELVLLSRNDPGISGIIAHEIAHIKKRHALRQILQGAGVFLLISAFTGDITSISTLAASLPILFVESGYSREFEREADRVAGRYLIQKGWGTKPYCDILEQLTKGQREYPQLTALSTHPRTKERIEDLKKLEKAMH